jgi:putative transposase
VFIEPNHIYHIYNQINNRQKIFFNRENYLYFLKKVKQHPLPYADILAWCLMPNHFHLLVAVREVQLGEISDRVTPSHPVTLRTPKKFSPIPSMVS